MEFTLQNMTVNETSPPSRIAQAAVAESVTPDAAAAIDMAKIEG